MRRATGARRSIRLRLTLLYGVLFLVSGAGLLAMTYVLVSRNTNGTLFASTGAGTIVTVNGPTTVIGGSAAGVTVPPGGAIAAGVAPSPTQLQTLAQQLTNLAAQQHDDEMHQLLLQSGVALAGMGVASIVLGWLVAGRVLRPLRTITATARSISASNLHRRIALRGPNDELKELGDTFDGLLGRLEQSFLAQRAFVANASHELRTPLARQRTLAEVALADPDATFESLRAAHQRVLAAGEQQERIIESLLTLARSERGLETRETFDLGEIVDTVVTARREEAAQRGVRIELMTEGAVPASGDVSMAERLVANLVDNGMRHNHRGGRVDVAVSSVRGRAVLRVTNTGAQVDPAEVGRLFEPFRRAGAQRVAGAGDGVGLGLSIVQAVATAHGASVSATARPEGGLAVEVTFAPLA